MQKPADCVLFTATLVWAWRAAILGLVQARGGSDIDIREVETGNLSQEAAGSAYVTAIDVEWVQERDRFGSPVWKRADNLPKWLVYAALRGAVPLAEAARAANPGACPHITFGADGIASAAPRVS